MKIRTRDNQAIMDAANGVLPSSLKHWWKCDEATGATSLVDSVAGANIPIGAITAASGVITTVPNIANADLGADLSDIGTADFMLIFRGETAGLGTLGFGNTSANKISLNGATLAASVVTGAGGSTNTDPTDNSLATWCVVRNSNDSGNIAVYKNGAIVGTSDADGSGAITLTGKMTFSGLDNLAMLALFVFPGTIPKDFALAAAWMGSNHASNNKWIWPSRNEAWGTWS